MIQGRLKEYQFYDLHLYRQLYLLFSQSSPKFLNGEYSLTRPASMQIYWNKRKLKVFRKEKSSTPTSRLWYTNMAALSVWNTNMMAVTK